MLWTITYPGITELFNDHAEFMARCAELDRGGASYTTGQWESFTAWLDSLLDEVAA